MPTRDDPVARGLGGAGGSSAYGSAVERLQAMVPVAVWGDPSATSWMQVAAMCLGMELQHAWDALAWITDQSYPARADENGLAYWEQLLGLVQNPPNLTTDQRREIVLARRRIAGAVQLPRIAALIAQYQRGTVSLAWAPLTATLTITWTDVLGVPDNLADVDRALRQYLPAWITIAYVYQYLTWDELAGTGKTWDQITADSLTWDQLLVTPAGSL